MKVALRFPLQSIGMKQVQPDTAVIDQVQLLGNHETVQV
jgi:hypothetical protein